MVDSTTLLNSSTFVKILGLKKIISLKRQIDFHLIFSSLLVFLHLSFQSTQRFHLLFFHNLYKCWLNYSENSSLCMDSSTWILLYEVSFVLFTFNLQDAIPHAMRRQTRNQHSTPMMTLIGSISQVSRPICAKLKMCSIF